MTRELSSSTSPEFAEVEYLSDDELFDDEKELFPCDVCGNIFEWGSLVFGACSECLMKAVGLEDERRRTYKHQAHAFRYGMSGSAFRKHMNKSYDYIIYDDVTMGVDYSTQEDTTVLRLLSKPEGE